jgi:hypothetical protein
MTEASVPNPLDAALDKKTFSVLDAVKGRSYPQDIVDVYTDAETALKVRRLEERINNERDAEQVNELDAEKAALIAHVKDSVLTFHLRGVAPGVVDGIQAQADEKFGADPSPDKFKWMNYSYLAANIISVTNAEGAVDEHLYTYEDVEQLAGYLPTSEFDKVFNLMQELTFARDLFDLSVSADF